MALKSARIVDLCGKSSGFADFKNTAGRGSAVIFDADSGLCLSYVRTWGPKRNLDHRSFFSLDRYVNEFIQIISFFERSSIKLKCGTVLGIVLYCCYQACCLLYYLGEINSGIHMYQPSLPLNLYTSVLGCDCSFGFEQKFWRIDGFGEKKARISGFAYPYSPPSLNKVSKPLISPRYTSPLRRLNFSTNSLHILHICKRTTEYLVRKTLSAGRGSLVLFMLAQVKINYAVRPRLPHLYQPAILSTRRPLLLSKLAAFGLWGLTSFREGVGVTSG